MFLFPEIQFPQTTLASVKISGPVKKFKGPSCLGAGCECCLWHALLFLLMAIFICLCFSLPNLTIHHILKTFKIYFKYYKILKKLQTFVGYRNQKYLKYNNFYYIFLLFYYRFFLLNSSPYFINILSIICLAPIQFLFFKNLAMFIKSA